MRDSVRIFVDFGECIVRDHLLFDYIAKLSNNEKSVWESPDSWNRVRGIGDVNFFDTIAEKFFSISEPYSEAPEVISSFCGKTEDSKSQIFVVYDNVPEVNLSNDKKNLLFSAALQNKKIECNGFFFASNDKTNLAKSQGVSIFVEDDPRIAISLSLSNIKTILMIRKWNSKFNMETMRLSLKPDKYKKLEENLYFAEDWFEAGILIGDLVDSAN
ncbi:MAG TPA: hypothetical protein VMZ91_07025 [Candidatus Paceibacterota bacterium]|nr:hypothetical protein [Candidatus Paceibacterota bacterium]